MMPKNNNNKFTITSLFALPVMRIELDLDLEKLTEFAFQMQNKDKKGIQETNRGGWHSDYIQEEKHEEFIRLKKEINQYLQTYHSEIFRGMKFKGNVIQKLVSMWTNINEKHHYNEWHIHGYSTLSGVYYIKHDGSGENGDIVFKHPNNLYMSKMHWPEGLIEKPNEVTADVMNITPTSNRLLIFPSWLEHKAEMNLNDNDRIALSFNAQPMLENHNG